MPRQRDGRRMKSASRDERAVLEVIELCSTLEERALGIYEFLHDTAVDVKLRDLWATLVADERAHRQYWQHLKEVCTAGGVPEVFDEPRRYVDELRTLSTRLDHLEAQLREDQSAPKVYVHALRLEFLLLHPSFVTLFHYLPEGPEANSPSRTYEHHLGRLLSACMDYQELSPEMELLGEAIGQVWKKSAEGVTRAVTDLQTGALNRRGLHIAMKPLTHLARREKETAGVMIMEITNLKAVNSRYGRQAGDALLVETARAIASRLRASDVVGRYGGDDFLVFLTRFDRGHFERVGRDVVRRVEGVSAGEARAVLTVGGACTVMEGDVEDRLENLIRSADSALEEARKRGRNFLVSEI